MGTDALTALQEEVDDALDVLYAWEGHHDAVLDQCGRRGISLRDPAIEALVRGLILARDEASSNLERAEMALDKWKDALENGFQCSCCERVSRQEEGWSMLHGLLQCPLCKSNGIRSL